MDPVSISIIVVGGSIVVAELGKYIKHKFSHHKSRGDERKVIITAESLDMNPYDLQKLMHDSKDNANSQDHSLSEDASTSSNFKGRNVRIEVLSRHTSEEDLHKSHTENGNSELAKHLATEVLPSIVNPIGGAAGKVANKVSKFLKKPNQESDGASGAGSATASPALSREHSQIENSKTQEDDAHKTHHRMKSKSDNIVRYDGSDEASPKISIKSLFKSKTCNGVTSTLPKITDADSVSSIADSGYATPHLDQVSTTELESVKTEYLANVIGGDDHLMESSV